MEAFANMCPLDTLFRSSTVNPFFRTGSKSKARTVRTYSWGLSGGEGPPYALAPFLSVPRSIQLFAPWTMSGSRRDASSSR